jgi:hypothetical protein
VSGPNDNEEHEAAMAVLFAALEACPDPALARDPLEVASEEA